MFKVLDKQCTPTKGSKYSACIDLYASEDITIGAGETVIVGLGVEIDLELTKKMIFENLYPLKENIEKTLKGITKEFLKSHYIQLEPRSSLRAKGLIVGTGVIDLDFIGHELKLIVHNPYNGHGASHIEIKKCDKIAQAMLCEHKSDLFGIESEDERNGGIGSTGN